MSKTRDCPHGRQIGKCSDCDLAELYDVATELDMTKSNIRRLEKENEALRATQSELVRALKSTGLFLQHVWCDVQMNDYSYGRLNQQIEVVAAALAKVGESE